MGNFGNYGNSPPPVVKDLREMSYRLTLEGGRISVHPPTLEAGHLRRLRENRTAVVAYLRRERMAETESLARAEFLGLIAKWARGHIGYISILDPTTGEYHDLQVKDAPEWARREARERRDMWKYEGVKGIPTARDMERRYQDRRTPEQGITEDLEAAS